jgi:hypothetical protein
MDWKFKENALSQGSSDGFWYDITCGGYIKLTELMEDKEQIKKLEEAIELVESFEQALIDNDLINEF